MSQKVDRVAVGVLGCFALLVLALAGSIVFFVIWLRSTAGGATSAAGDPAAPPPFRTEPCAAPPGRVKEIAEPMRARDLARVDVAEVYDQARSLALRVEPNARLVSIAAAPGSAGTFNSEQAILGFHFEYQCLTPDASSGSTLHRGLVQVTQARGTLTGRRTPDVEASRLTEHGPLPEPPCSTAAAWITASATGLPPSSQASFLYSYAKGSPPAGVWIVTAVEAGSPREVDGATCRLRERSPLHSHLTDPGGDLPDLHPQAPAATAADPVLPAPSATASATASATTSATAQADEPYFRFPGTLEWERPVEAADMTAVDLAALVPQARTIAEKLQPGAQFTGIVAFDVTRGMADLTGAGRVLYELEYVGQDPEAPPEKDTIERTITVTAQGGKLVGRRRNIPAATLKHAGGAVEPPTCTSAAAWAVAVKSGVPDTAVATIHYEDHTPFKPGGPWVWSIRVAGHDEHRREIDGKTCAMVKNWSRTAKEGADNKPPAGASGQAPSAPQAAGSGGCRVHVYSNRPVAATLDGRPVGTTPLVNLPVSCGSHKVTLTDRQLGRKTIPFWVGPDRPGHVEFHW